MRLEGQIDNFACREDAELVEADAQARGIHCYIRNWHRTVKGWYVIRYDNYERIAVMTWYLEALRKGEQNEQRKNRVGYAQSG